MFTKLKASIVVCRAQIAQIVNHAIWVLGVMWHAVPALMLGLLAAISVQAVITPVELLLLRKLINMITAWLQDNAFYGLNTWRSLFIVLSAVAGASLLRSAANHITEYANVMLRDKVANYLSELISTKGRKVAYTLLEDASFCNLLDRARRGAQTKVGALVENTISISRALSQCVSLCIMVTYINAYIPVLLALMIPFMLGTYLRGNANIWQIYRGQSEDVRRVNYLTQLLTSRSTAHEVRLYDLGAHFSGIWHSYTSRMRKQHLAVLRRNELWRSASVMCLAGVAIYGIWKLMWKIAGRTLTVGDYIALANALFQLITQMEEALYFAGRLHGSLLICSDIKEFLATEEELPPKGSAPLSFPLRKAFQFDHVSFQYPGTTQKTLKDISFSISPGESVAIVGSNGAGKTTLVKLLLGLYPPTEGRILYDDIQLDTGNRQSLWDATAVLFQDFVRYQLSIRQNIGFGNLANMGDDNELLAAAELSGAADIITKLPAGLDAELGKLSGNTDLSGGEWQKVALSRALFRHAHLIVLDEPTASLDPLAEADLYQRFTTITQGRTVILISHRLGSARLANRILVLKDGQLVEVGSHEELMARNGEYAKMYEMQAAWYAEAGVVLNA